MGAAEISAQGRADLVIKELRIDAAIHGDGIGRAVQRRVESRFTPAQRRQFGGGAAWRQMSPELRQVLIALGTNRHDAEACAGMAWEQFKPDEQSALGSMARQWARELQNSGWLR